MQRVNEEQRVLVQHPQSARGILASATAGCMLRRSCVGVVCREIFRAHSPTACCGRYLGKHVLSFSSGFLSRRARPHPPPSAKLASVKITHGCSVGHALRRRLRCCLNSQHPQPRQRPLHGHHVARKPCIHARSHTILTVWHLFPAHRPATCITGTAQPLLTTRRRWQPDHQMHKGPAPPPQTRCACPAVPSLAPAPCQPPVCTADGRSWQHCRRALYPPPPSSAADGLSWKQHCRSEPSPALQC